MCVWYVCVVCDVFKICIYMCVWVCVSVVCVYSVVCVCVCVCVFKLSFVYQCVVCGGEWM